MLSHPLTNFEIQTNFKIQKYSKLKFNALIALYVNNDNVTYFDGFWVEYIPKEIEKFVGNKNVSTNICNDEFNGDFFLTEIHSMQGWAATTRHRVTRKRSKQRLVI